MAAQAAPVRTKKNIILFFLWLKDDFSLQESGAYIHMVHN